MSNLVFYKWSPQNCEDFERTKLEDKKKIMDNNVMETILQEGNEFITKRESQQNKLNDRELIAQTNLNPFLQGDYVSDLNVQEKFLTPQNSNYLN